MGAIESKGILTAYDMEIQYDKYDRWCCIWIMMKGKIALQESEAFPTIPQQRRIGYLYDLGYGFGSW